MSNLYLKFNESLEFVSVKLEGSGTLFIEEKREHVDLLILELSNFIKHERPSKLIFTSHINTRLINELELLGIYFDNISNKLTYND